MSTDTYSITAAAAARAAAWREADEALDARREATAAAARAETAARRAEAREAVEAREHPHIITLAERRAHDEREHARIDAAYLAAHGAASYTAGAVPGQVTLLDADGARLGYAPAPPEPSELPYQIRYAAGARDGAKRAVARRTEAEARSRRANQAVAEAAAAYDRAVNRQFVGRRVAAPSPDGRTLADRSEGEYLAYTSGRAGRPAQHTVRLADGSIYTGGWCWLEGDLLIGEVIRRLLVPGTLDGRA